MNLLENIEKSVYLLWMKLNSEGSINENKILNSIKIEDFLLYEAVGWLARENKIRFNNNYYSLGETNLKSKIGLDAGKVWQVLDTWGVVEIKSITKLARINEKDVFFAVGWLAKEGKIDGEIIDPKKNKIKFWLK
jgi:hypothetical protein